jgi:hypothetical protein
MPPKKNLAKDFEAAKLEQLVEEMGAAVEDVNAAFQKLKGHVDGTIPILSGDHRMQAVIDKYDKTPATQKKKLITPICINKKNKVDIIISDEEDHADEGSSDADSDSGSDIDSEESAETDDNPAAPTIVFRKKKKNKHDLGVKTGSIKKKSPAKKVDVLSAIKHMETKINKRN